jgi:hypothetical protein
VATVVLVAVVPVLEPVVLVEAAAAAAAVVRPANASRSPQARMERRKSFTSPKVDCKSEAERAGRRPDFWPGVGGLAAGVPALRRAPLGAAYAIVVTSVTVATFVLC